MWYYKARQRLVGRLVKARDIHVGGGAGMKMICVDTPFKAFLLLGIKKVSESKNKKYEAKCIKRFGFIRLCVHEFSQQRL